MPKSIINIRKTINSICHAIIAMAVVVVATLWSTTAATAQDSKYKFDIGASIGMGSYVGDASNSIVKHMGFTGDINGRYLFNSRLAARALLTATSISGNTADMKNVLPGGVNYKFKGMAYSLEARGEFNFFPYGIGERYKGLKRLTPYITLGVGVTLATCSGNTVVAPSVPFGVGVKFKLNPRLNIGAEFTMSKVFSDKVDGDKLHDLTGIKTGFLKSTDWISRISVGVTYEFGERCETCHYVE